MYEFHMYEAERDNKNKANAIAEAARPYLLGWRALSSGRRTKRNTEEWILSSEGLLISRLRERKDSSRCDSSTRVPAKDGEGAAECSGMVKIKNKTLAGHKTKNETKTRPRSRQQVRIW